MRPSARSFLSLFIVIFAKLVPASTCAVASFFVMQFAFGPIALAGDFVPTGNLSVPRFGHAASLLSNGKVLVTAGYENGVVGNTCELYDPVAGTFSATAKLNNSRCFHTQTTLPSGKVLVVGGANDFGTLNTSEIYDPVANTWTLTGNLATVRTYFQTTLLASGKLLATGGYNGAYVASAEIFDPATNLWSPAGTMSVPHELHTATLLPNGQVLVVGGETSSQVSVAPSVVELFDPSTNTWILGPPLTDLRIDHFAILLSTGKVLVSGGHDEIGSTFGTSLLYDYTSNSWSPIGSLNTARSGCAATLMPNGAVLIAGGGNATGFFTSAELYDPKTGLWSLVGDMAYERFHATQTLLQNGIVLVAGGQSATSDTNTAELYVPERTIIHSGPSASPNPAVALQLMSFAVTATNTAQDTLSYNWDFGDGAQTTGNPVAHAYTAVGNYTATLNITSGAAPVAAIVNVLVALQMGSGPDTDGDGFSDSFEMAAGSDPANAASTPTGQVLQAVQPLTVDKIAVKLNPTRSGTDSISFSGTLSIPAGFVSQGKNVVLDVGGVIRKFTLDTKGSAKNGNDNLKIAIHSSTGVVSGRTSAYMVNLKKGSFSAALSVNAGLADGDFKTVQKTVVVSLLFNNADFQKVQAVTYSAKKGKSGAAK